MFTRREVHSRSLALAATAWERARAFESRLCSAESLSARVTHRGSHLPGVTDRPAKGNAAQFTRLFAGQPQCHSCHAPSNPRYLQPKPLQPPGVEACEKSDTSC